MKQKVALVTGGSRGIGAAICKQLASEGMWVAVNYLSNKESADKVVSEIIEHGGKAMAFQADVRDSKSIENLVLEVSKNLGNVDVFVSNANIDFPMKPFTAMSWDEFSTKINNELFAAFETTKHLVTPMRLNGFGRIVFISSSLSKHIIPSFSAHGTAKGALNVFAQYLAQELGPDGITVNVVGPGFTETDATKEISSEQKEFFKQITPLRKVAKPSDIANGVAFLLSENASHVTGSYLPIDGGI